MSSYPFPWGPPPVGYVPGVGRGAEGFINSLELGELDFETEIKSLDVLKQIRQEAQKANAFYQSIDDAMKSRNKKKKKEESVSATKQIFNEIGNEFAHLKLGLQSVPVEDWENLPEIGATTYHRPKWDLYTHASDRMIANDFEDSALNRLARNDETVDDDSLTGDTDSQIMTVARAHRSVLNVQLSRIIPEQNTIDPAQFLGELDEQASKIIVQFDDLEHAAALYRTLTHTNSDNPQSWLIRARVEEQRGKLDKARKIAREGMIHCPQSELMVLEAARLSPRQDAITLLQSALQVNHKSSEKLWLQLIAYQPSLSMKKSTIENAIRAIPKNEKIWLAAAAYEDGEEHSTILKRALDFLPNSKALWIEAINSSSNYEEALEFVKNALEQLGDSPDIYIAWAESDEKFNNSNDLDEICQKAVSTSPLKLTPTYPNPPNNTIKDIDESSQGENDHKTEGVDWIAEAMKVEKLNFFNTAIKLIDAIPLDSFGSIEKILSDASMAENCGFENIAKELFLRNAIENGYYIEYIEFEKRHGDFEDAVKLAIESDPLNENLAVSISDVYDQPNQKTQVLENAMKRIQNSELIAMSLIDSYLSEKRMRKAQQFARSIVNQPSFENSLQIHSILAIINDQFGEDIDFLRESIRKFPRYSKFYIMLSEYSDAPQELLKFGLDNCPHSPELYVAYIKSLLVDLQKNKLLKTRIRALFEKARRLCPNDAVIWLLASEFEPPEMRVKLLEEAIRTVNKNDIGIVWSRQIEIYGDPEQRLTLCREALQEVKAPELYLLLGIYHWKRGQIDQARTILTNLSKEFPSFGDGWIFRINFEKGNGSPEECEIAIKEASMQKIKDGLVWKFNKSLKENFEMLQSELLEHLVEWAPDPVVSEESLYNDILLQIDRFL